MLEKKQDLPQPFTKVNFIGNKIDPLKVENSEIKEDLKKTLSFSELSMQKKVERLQRKPKSKTWARYPKLLRLPPSSPKHGYKSPGTAYENLQLLRQRN